MTRTKTRSLRDTIHLSASEMAGALKAGDLSAEEVVDVHIDHIQKVNPALNAVVIPLFDEARAQARMADEVRARGEPLGALYGVPVTIKEQYKVRGTQTTLGATNKIGNVYDDEGPLVTELRAEGAIILGKTNIVQTLLGHESDNRVYGRSNNPWDLGRTPGGSSGGDAAIVAAGGAPLALASDLGGSIRIPSLCCGVHGFKPTTGRLTNDDFPGELLGYGQEAILPQPGPIARTVADLALAMAVFARTSMNATCDNVPPVPWTDPTTISIKGMRIGYYTDNGLLSASPALRRAVEEGAEALRSMGAETVPVDAPDPFEAMRIFLGVMTAGGVAQMKSLLGAEKPIPQIAAAVKGMGTPRLVLAMVARLMAARGQHHNARVIGNMGALKTADYWHLVEARTDYRISFQRALDAAGLDAVICPPHAVPAVTHGASEHLFPAVSYAFTYNVLGAPAGVVSTTRVRPGEESDRDVGKDIADRTAQQVEQGSAGLPVGVQVVARHWHDHVALAVMEALEAHFRKKEEYPLQPDFPINI
ncbi:MAG: amidase [Rhodobacteraceae bacterium]|nr:amidase [Paracoccaceae bacterium]